MMGQQQMMGQPMMQQPMQMQPPMQQMQRQQQPMQADVDASWTGCQGCVPGCVDEGNVAVMQRFGAYQGFATPGIVWYCPPCCSMKQVSIAMPHDAYKGF